MNIRRLRPSPLLAVAVGALVVGLAAPAAASEASHMINGKSLKNHSVTGKKLKNNTVTGKQVEESTLGTVPRAAKLTPLKWHNITSFENGWVDYPAYVRAGYAVDAQGVFHLRGVIKGGTSATEAFVIPGVHIYDLMLLPVQADKGVGLIRVTNDGGVFPTNQMDGTEDVTDGLDLDGVTFTNRTGKAAAVITGTKSTPHGGAFGSR